MAELTLAQIRQTIRDRGDYQNTRKFTNTFLDTLAQQAFGKFWQLVDSTHSGWWDTDTTTTTTNNVAFVATPTNCWKVNGVDILDGEYRELRQVSRTERNRYSASTDKPSAYYLSARGIELLATPNAAYTLRVLYTPRAPALAESQPREWFNGWEEYVIVSVLCVLDEREGSPHLRDRQATLVEIEKSVRQGAGERRQQEPEYINLRENASLDPWYDGDY